MRKLINLFSLNINILCLFVAFFNFDLYALTGSFLLIAINKLKRCPSIHYLSFIFSLFYSLRYLFIRGLNFSSLYPISNINNCIGFYFFISVIFYSLIAVSVNYSSGKYTYNQYSKSRPLDFQKIGKLSIILFSIPVFMGTYSIGREVENFSSKLMLRVSSFFNYFQPFIFESSYAVLWIGLFSLALIFFGSKAFIYSLLVNFLIFSTVKDLRVNYKYFSIFMILAFISIFTFDLMTYYRITKEFNLSLILDHKSFFEIFNGVAMRFGGLDTLIAYGDIGFQFSISDLWNELLIAINSFLIFIEISIPKDYVPSEMRTALIFRDYDFAAHIDGLRHTDSMFGLSRFVAIEDGLGIIFLLACLILSFLLFRSKDYYLNIILKIFFYNELLIGGAYYTIFRFAFEITLIFLLVRLSFVRKLLLKI